MSDHNAALDRAFHHAVSYLDGLAHRRVASNASYTGLVEKLDRPLPQAGAPAAQVIDELASDVAEGLVGSAGGRFFGWVIGGGLEAAVGAEILTAVWDQNAALYACSPAAAVVEEIAGRWILDLLELPSAASVAFTTGCQMAHVTALAAARRALLLRTGWDADADGLADAPRLRILTSGEAHASIARACGVLGLGRKSVQALASDQDGRLSEESLRAALAVAPTQPTVLVLQAADLNIGAFDDFATLIPTAKAAGAWVHVDGAFGLWARTSARYRHFLDGVERADSWATDGHKWLNVPYDSGLAVVLDREAHRGALSLRASYLTHDDTARDQIDWNPEWSRRARGFAVYAALRQLGREGLRDLVDRSCAHARALTAGIGEIAGAEVLWRPTLNQGLIRFSDPRPDAAEEDHDAFTDLIITRIVSNGEAFFGGTTWRGRRAMRISVCNWRTDEDDVRRSIAAVAAAVDRTRSDLGA